mgnify:CR=1 FL=1
MLQKVCFHLIFGSSVCSFAAVIIICVFYLNGYIECMKLQKYIINAMTHAAINVVVQMTIPAKYICILKLQPNMCMK